MGPFRKNKVATFLAAFYLLLVLLVSSPLLYDSFFQGCQGGMHSAASMSLLFTLFVTMPLSWLSFQAMDAYPATDEAARCLVRQSDAIPAFDHCFDLGLQRIRQCRDVGAGRFQRLSR